MKIIPCIYNPWWLLREALISNKIIRFAIIVEKNITNLEKSFNDWRIKSGPFCNTRTPLEE